MTKATLVGRWTDSSNPEFQNVNLAYGKDILRYYTDNENFDLLARRETFRKNDYEQVKMLNLPLEKQGIEKSIFLQRYFDANTVILIKDSIYVNPAYFRQENFRKMLPEIIDEGFDMLKGKYKPQTSNIVNINFKRKFESLSDKDVLSFFMDAYKKENEKNIQKLKKSTEELNNLNSKLKTDVFLKK